MLVVDLRGEGPTYHRSRWGYTEVVALVEVNLRFWAVLDGVTSAGPTEIAFNVDG